MKHEDLKFEDGLDYTVKPCLNRIKQLGITVCACGQSSQDAVAAERCRGQPRLYSEMLSQKYPGLGIQLGDRMLVYHVYGPRFNP